MAQVKFSCDIWRRKNHGESFARREIRLEFRLEEALLRPPFVPALFNILWAVRAGQFIVGDFFVTGRCLKFVVNVVVAFDFV